MAGEEGERKRAKGDGCEGQIIPDLISHCKDFGFTLYQIGIHTVFQAEEWHHLNYLFFKSIWLCVCIDLSGQT